MCTDRMHFQKGSSHKTDLCQYQHLDLCQQWNTIKSSYQESENKRKNKKRLQSSTMQKFSTHFIYNMLMDYYQNEEIVNKQKKSLLGILKENQHIERDEYKRFIIKDKHLACSQ